MEACKETALKRARSAMGLSQKDLATRVGIKQESLSNFETMRAKPRPETAELLVFALENTVTLEQLLFPARFLTDLLSDK